jgi:hypothetical protein
VRRLGFLGTLRDARVPFVAADTPHASALTVDILGAVAAEEARRIVEGPGAALAARRLGGAVLGGPGNFTAAGRALGAERTRTQRRGCFLVWTLVRAPTVKWLRAAQEKSLRALDRALKVADVPTPTGHYEWHSYYITRVLDWLQSGLSTACEAERPCSWSGAVRRRAVATGGAPAGTD